MINYLDRKNLSIAAPSITSEFGLVSVQLGVVFSAFGWTYTPLQIPGLAVDRVHPRMLYPLTIFFWSIATLCLGLSTGLVMLIILRMTVGLFEVPSFLINNRIATTCSASVSVPPASQAVHICRVRRPRLPYPATRVAKERSVGRQYSSLLARSGWRGRSCSGMPTTIQGSSWR